jgi:hypothetical protein
MGDDGRGQDRQKAKALAALAVAGCWPPNYANHPLTEGDRAGLADVIRVDLDDLEGPELIAVAALVRRLAMGWESDDDPSLDVWRDAIGGWE